MIYNAQIRATNEILVMNLKQLRDAYREQILSIATLCNADNVRIFGSVARNQASGNSDIDILVHMKPGSGFCIGGLQWRLEELLGVKVDVVPDTSLHPSIKDKILNEAILL